MPLQVCAQRCESGVAPVGRSATINAIASLGYYTQVNKDKDTIQHSEKARRLLDLGAVQLEPVPLPRLHSVLVILGGQWRI